MKDQKLLEMCSNSKCMKKKEWWNLYMSTHSIKSNNIMSNISASLLKKRLVSDTHYKNSEYNEKGVLII